MQDPIINDIIVLHQPTEIHNKDFIVTDNTISDLFAEICNDQTRCTNLNDGWLSDLEMSYVYPNEAQEKKLNNKQ